MMKPYIMYYFLSSPEYVPDVPKSLPLHLHVHSSVIATTRGQTLEHGSFGGSLDSSVSVAFYETHKEILRVYGYGMV